MGTPGRLWKLMGDQCAFLCNLKVSTDRWMDWKFNMSGCGCDYMGASENVGMWVCV